MALKLARSRAGDCGLWDSGSLPALRGCGGYDSGWAGRTYRVYVQRADHVFVAPHFHRVAKNRQVKAFVDGVTAAATGAIAGAAVILGRRSLVDLPTALIALATLALLLAPRKIPEPVLVVAAGLVGLVLRGTVPAAG